jgi:hypothetical protein
VGNSSFILSYNVNPHQHNFFSYKIEYGNNILINKINVAWCNVFIVAVCAGLLSKEQDSLIWLKQRRKGKHFVKRRVRSPASECEVGTHLNSGLVCICYLVFIELLFL